MTAFFGSEEEARKQLELIEMAKTDAINRLQTFFEGLNEEQLAVMAILLHAFSHDRDGHMATYYHGQIALLMRQRDVCIRCGSSECEHTMKVNTAEVLDSMAEYAVEKTVRKKIPELKDIEEYLARCEEYNVEDVNAESDEDIRVKCKNCGQIYSGLFDRELKDPGVEGCSGCQQKAKFG